MEPSSEMKYVVIFDGVDSTIMEMPVDQHVGEHLKNSAQYFTTLTAARNVLADDLRQKRNAWGDAIRRVEAITKRNIVTWTAQPRPAVKPSPQVVALVPRGAQGCTCGTPPFAPREPSADCPFHGINAPQPAS
jgi:hypothetical protein